jgi:hypothetical protein
LREEYTLIVFENMMLRRIFEPKSEEVMGGCKNCALFENVVLRRLHEPKWGKVMEGCRKLQ